jgi:hypothetical protein
MEAAATFLLVIVFVAVLIVGGGVYAIASWLRKRQLSPEGDKVEGPASEPRRPGHVEVESEQHTHFVGTR